MIHRFVASLFIAAAVAALLLISSPTSARSLLPVNDVSEGPFANIDSNHRSTTAIGSNVEVTWEGASGHHYTRDSVDNGLSFGAQLDTTDYWIKYDALAGRQSTAVVGDNVYEAWSIFQGGGQFFRYSHDAGKTWSKPAKLTDVSFAEIPTVVALGDRVFIVWDEGGDLFAASSFNRGVTLNPATDLGPNFFGSIVALADGGVAIAVSPVGHIAVETFPTGDFRDNPVTMQFPVDAKGQTEALKLAPTPTGSVVISWTWAPDVKPTSTETINFSYSKDRGMNWAQPVILDTTTNFSTPVFAAGTAGWLFAWGELSPSGYGIDARAFYDSGATDGGVIQLVEDHSNYPSISVVGDTGFLAWANNAASEMTLATIPRGGVPAIVTIPGNVQSNPELVTSGPDYSASVYLTWFGVDPNSNERHLYFTRAVITGSMDCTGKIGEPDILAALRAFAGLPGDQPCKGAADVNCDGAVTGVDVLLLANHVAGLPEPVLPRCSPIGT